MLVKIHDFFKISLNLCEIHHNEFWFQNADQFQRCRTSNFDFSFLCSKMRFFKLKSLELFYCWKLCNQKYFRSSLYWYEELRQEWQMVPTHSCTNLTLSTSGRSLCFRSQRYSLLINSKVTTIFTTRQSMRWLIWSWASSHIVCLKMKMVD